MLDATSSSTLCSTCATTFSDTSARREHMRSDWHVFNVKRKVAELPPVPLDFFENEVHTIASASTLADGDTSKYRSTSPSNQDIEFDQDELFIALPEQCLFCSSAHDDTEANLLHMTAIHGFHIPNQDLLETDLETLLAYLSMVIHRFHTCLLCGHQKSSGEAVQAHMLSRGHCMLDMSSGSEFLEFWSSEDGFDDHSSHQQLSETELRLSSGAIVSSRHDGRPSNKARKPTSNPKDSTSLVLASTSTEDEQDQDSTAGSETTDAKPTTQALAKRDMMGIVGLSDQQKRALVRVQQKTVSRERRYQTEARWTLEKFNNKTKQKHFVVSRSGVHSAMQVY